MAHRLPPQPNEWISREQPVQFQFEGERYEAYAGDTVSSALLANGRRMLGRSFKYHRPRGVLSGANHDSNVLLQTGSRLNLRGDVEPVTAGEAYTAVNTFGGLKWDWAQSLEWLAPLLPVGFYYKAFFKPRWMFPWWERIIRSVSGLGYVTSAFPATRQPHRRVYCDCVIIGAGATGMAAARVLAEQGLEILLIDENAQIGGSLGYTARTDEQSAWFTATRNFLANAAQVAVHTHSFAAGLYTDFEVPLIAPAGMTVVTARSVLVATGAIEQPAVFRNNDLPGVMLASAAQRMVHRYGVAPFERGVVLAGNVDAYDAALDLLDCGLRIEALLDLEDPATRGERAQALKSRGVRVIGHAKALEARAKGQALARVALRIDGVAEEIECDGLLMSVGWAPASALLHQGGARFAYDTALDQMIPHELPSGLVAAGRVNGRYRFAARVADGEAAAQEILQALGRPAVGRERPALEREVRSHPRPWFAHAKAKNFVDFDEDIQLHDLEIACREGFDNVELLKRYTTNGMGPSQGKHSNLNAARWLADYQGKTLAEIGSTTARPFYHPVAMGTLAGRRVRPQAESALNALHDQAQAQWMEVGQWRRPRFYRRGSPDISRRAEYQAVRERIGMIDVSTLGKFEIFGPDAARLLNLCYTSAVDKTALGMTRYVLMCDHRGTIVDDGVAARLAEHHFYVTAGSSHAPATYRQLTQIAALFKLEVEVIDMTRQLAAINIAGPRVRALLREVTTQDLSDASFPFLGVRDGTLCGLPVRLMRVGFVGEVGYEVHLSYTDAPRLWRELLRLGAADEILTFGLETQRLLRLEKGHLIVGQDTDGVMHPFETPLAGLVNFKKPQFLGKAALETLRENPQRRLVGFETNDPAAATIEECHLIIEHRAILGRVTSVGYSPVLGKTVGLAVFERQTDTARFQIRTSAAVLVDARTLATPFYDPTNARQKEDGV